MLKDEKRRMSQNIPVPRENRYSTSPTYKQYILKIQSVQSVPFTIMEKATTQQTNKRRILLCKSMESVAARLMYMVRALNGQGSAARPLELCFAPLSPELERAVCLLGPSKPQKGRPSNFHSRHRSFTRINTSLCLDDPIACGHRSSSGCPSISSPFDTFSTY